MVLLSGRRPDLDLKTVSKGQTKTDQPTSHPLSSGASMNQLTRMYPPELQLNKDSASATEALCLRFTFVYFTRIWCHPKFMINSMNLILTLTLNFLSLLIFFFFFFVGDVPCFISYGVNISQPICFARVSSHVTDFNDRYFILLLNFSNRTIGIINFKKGLQFYRH